MAASEGGLVVYRAAGGIDAIDEYSRRLTEALCRVGTPARYLSGGTAEVLAAEAAPDWILLQYNPFSYGRFGFAPGLVRDISRIRRRFDTRLVVMVHEAWMNVWDLRWGAVGLWHHIQTRALLRFADDVLTSTEALAKEVGRGALHIPVAATIDAAPTSPAAARARLGLDGKLVVALLGRGHPSRALGHAETAIAALARAHGAARISILNLGADAPPIRVPPDVEVSNPGPLADEELSLRLSASDLVLLPFTDGLSTRRTTLMAALSHGRPVLGLRGAHTDAVLAEARGALMLTPADNPARFAEAALELTSDPDRMSAVGAAGRRLYESTFDWPVLAGRVSAAVRRPSNERRVVFVAHDVGGTGGMERHSSELITGLLNRGRSVTVIARTCQLDPHDGLRFVRVRTPRRPFTLAYPAFFIVGSLLAARQRKAILHTTGAVVLNRADLSTVHYCHRGAQGKVSALRVSRDGPLYRLNAIVADTLAQAAERFCYRPQRSRVLCAVSGGLAAELQDAFPAMCRAVRTIRNGVDTGVFRPDATARQQVRADLGLSERSALALFVGGDWERKGLLHAVRALESAPDWHLAVAGIGDWEQVGTQAGAVAPRLHFLGQVLEMPRLYAAADALVLPTAYETFSLVTYEAAASGLPLLVTRVSGVDELLEEGANGWYIARDPVDIAQRLNALTAQPSLAHAMSSAARAVAMGFSWQKMVNSYVSLYDELAGADPASATAVTDR